MSGERVARGPSVSEQWRARPSRSAPFGLMRARSFFQNTSPSPRVARCVVCCSWWARTVRGGLLFPRCVSHNCWLVRHLAPVYAHSDSRRATFYGLRIFAVARICHHVLRPHCLRGNLARRVIDRSIALTRHAGRTSCVRQWRNFPRLTDNRLRRHLYTKCQSAIYIAIGFNLLSELYRVSEKSALFKQEMVSRLRAILSTLVAVKLRQGHSRTSFRTFTIVHVEMKR